MPSQLKRAWSPTYGRTEMARKEDPAVTDVKKRFAANTLMDNEKAQVVESFRKQLEKLSLQALKTLPNNRQRSLLLTDLESAHHWAEASVQYGAIETPPAAISTQQQVTKATATKDEPLASVTPIKKTAAKKTAAAPKADAPQKAAAKKTTSPKDDEPPPRPRRAI
jgi:hypothetical protein